MTGAINAERTSITLSDGSVIDVRSAFIAPVAPFIKLIPRLCALCVYAPPPFA